MVTRSIRNRLVLVVVTIITATVVATGSAAQEPGVGHGITETPVTFDHPGSEVRTSSIPGAAPLTLVGNTDAEARLVEDVLDRFADAGLALPSLHITFVDDMARCGGHSGIYHGEGDIIICQTSLYVLAHETAHAWEEAALTDSDRVAYQQLTGAPTWRSHDHSWADRAIEKAANTIAWALTMTNPRPNEMFHAHLCTFEPLTGRQLPNPLSDPCLPGIDG